MTWPEALGYLKSGKCKGLTRLDLPSKFQLTLWKYTRTFYWYDKGFTDVKPKYDPEDVILFAGNDIDSPGRWVNLGMWNDNNWLICERVWDKEDL